MVVIVVVVASSAALLLAEWPLTEALPMAAVTVLLTGELARRLLPQTAPLPVITSTTVMTALAIVLLLRGLTPAEVAVAVGLTGIVARHVATRFAVGSPAGRGV